RHTPHTTPRLFPFPLHSRSPSFIPSALSRGHTPQLVSLWRTARGGRDGSTSTLHHHPAGRPHTSAASPLPDKHTHTHTQTHSHTNTLSHTNTDTNTHSYTNTHTPTY